MTALSTVGICQQFTSADSLCSREIHDASWSLCLAAELIDWHPWYLCRECTDLITVRLRWSFNCSLVQGIEFGTHHYTKMVWPIMRNCKLLNLFLRRCLSISVHMGCTAQAQASVNCRRQWPLVVSAVACLMTMLNYCNHFSGTLVKTSSLTPHPSTLFRP